MRVGIHQYYAVPMSIKNYTNNIISGLTRSGLKTVRFSNFEEAIKMRKEVDLFWFPGCAGGGAPPKEFVSLADKIVVTLHGAAPFTIPFYIYYDSIRRAIRGTIFKYISFLRWQTFKNRVKAVITVSEYAKAELCSKLKIPEHKVFPVYHGIDTDLFRPADKKKIKRYLLHVSHYQPLKNVDRIVKAYKMLASPRPGLLLVVPGYQGNIDDSDITAIKEPKSSEELVQFYQEAVAFVFPSLRETFGMPILEAMACGCPVITTNTTGCAEVAGDAALLVNPYSVDDIARAMQKLLVNEELAESLKKKGLERVKDFSWEESARQHLEIFKRVIEKNNL